VITSEGPADGDEDMVWQYEDGEWSRTPGPYVWEATDGRDVEPALERAGFNHAEQLGRPRLPIVQIYEHEDGGKWFLSCCFNHSNVYSIYVPNLPSFLDLMAKLTPVVTSHAPVRRGREARSSRHPGRGRRRQHIRGTHGPPARLATPVGGRLREASAPSAERGADRLRLILFSDG